MVSNFLIATGELLLGEPLCSPFFGKERMLKQTESVVRIWLKDADNRYSYIEQKLEKTPKEIAEESELSI